MRPLLVPVLAACPGRAPEYSNTDPGEVVPGGQDFSALDALLDERIEDGSVNGFAMQITDATGAVVYRREEGICAVPASCGAGGPEFTVSLITSIASSSKWLTSTVILAAVDEEVAAGTFESVAEALDTDVVSSLDCGGLDGPVTGITLRQLLSFTSGVIANHDCTATNATLQDCACSVLTDSADAMSPDPPSSQGARTRAHPPGTTYKYGASHHAVAGAWAEQITGRSWDELLRRHVLDPVGAQIDYRRDTNLAGSGITSVADFTRFVDAVRADSRAVAEGNPDGTALLSAEALAGQRAPEVPADAVELIRPATEAEYGLNVWRNCLAPFDQADATGPVSGLPALADPACDDVFQVGHEGKGGYIPFIDDAGRYAAVLAIREDSAGAGDQYSEEELALSVRAQMLVHLAMTE